MKIKKLKIKDYETENNLFLAPMAGYTDFAVRSLFLSVGAGLSFTELISAKGLEYNVNGSKKLLYSEDYSKTAAQLFGHEEYYLRAAMESEILKDYRICDINMGCPVPKICKNGDGSALLADGRKAEKIIKECVKSGKIITVKIRTGIKEGDDVAEEFAKIAEGSGASLITVHGRVREKYYSGEPDYNAIAKAKRAVKIPLIANGGIFTEEDADKMINETGADGIMLARGALSDVFLFEKLQGVKPDFDKKTFIFTQLDKQSERFGEKFTAVAFRKFVPYYFKNAENAKEHRIRLMQTASVEEIKDIINEIL